MPALDLTAELFAGIENPVIVVLVVDRPRQAVPKHALCQWWQSLYRVLLQKGCRRRGLVFRRVMGSGCAELVELIFGLCSSARCPWTTATPR